jgi:hypothetical protein
MTRNTERFFLEKVLFLVSYYYVAFFVVLLHGTLIHIFSYMLLFYHVCVGGCLLACECGAFSHPR